MTARAPSRRRTPAAPPGQADLFAPPPSAQEPPPAPAAVPLPATLPAVADDLWERLSRSRFRARFHLDAKDRAYLHRQGLQSVSGHAAEFIATRLAPAHPHKDGRQTPWRGHPVFVAQHATGTCCRGCIEKWHGFAKGQELQQPQRDYILAVIRGWLLREDPDCSE
ncbi:DUF4186 domain-containing protein [Gluconacetobacter entanii]|uniref:DUF4186 domain-containing protein n=1 Tax=Gluconacetobacter entanii TaxID=108528 RepID=A0ABT3K8H7_9PROT|nr:DUF4186 domain-containing protein [Gluconacetobacter entanii]MBE7620315.1 DUF4186 family protein [Komagataeibacter sp. FXV2]MBY4640862.1 DUF4186 domain-containing protein [Gluconacetobacter entanii]MCW4579724.1 DUF4186 domain-containing protein [Gluconacetobacter entanii]MCW4583130.1 DUF4186 domain-containing protein [Gluconacetobacter entanii]MCW4586493.1 DUF4186 domain-containing protein [Gluconacetobacter entanii]